jgi:hypothetical protein
VQLFISESDYPHAAQLCFDVSELALLRFTSPAIQRVELAKYILLPRRRLPVSFELLGGRSVAQGRHAITASLVAENGEVAAAERQDLAAGGETVVLDASKLSPGRYQVELTIADRDGESQATASREVEAVAGPTYTP